MLEREVVVHVCFYNNGGQLFAKNGYNCVIKVHRDIGINDVICRRIIELQVRILNLIEM